MPQASTRAANKRLEAIKKRMREADLDAILAISTSYHNFLDIDPVLVATGFKPMGESAVVISPAEDWLFVTPAWDASRAARDGAVKSVAGVGDILTPIKKLIAEHSWRRIGISGLDNIPEGLATSVRTLCASKLVSAHDLMREAGNIFTPERIEAAEKATAIAEDCYDHFLQFVRPGMREREVALELYDRAKNLGADDNFMLVTASQHGRGITVASERFICEHDLIVVEITPSVGGQFIQLPRTAYMGEPPPVLVEKFDLLHQSYLAGEKAARPGATAGEVANAMNAVLADAGYADYCRPPFMRVRGHGMGNIANLPGDLVMGNDSVFEEDMVLVIHPEQYLPEIGYTLVGEPVRITKQGAVPLTKRRVPLEIVSAG